jgi:catechol 2,3-dioxygenase-like lactoylglutathione lyase family enzyme
MLQQIDHVNLVVRDLQRMTAFYVDVLGLKVTKQVTIHGEWVDQVVGLAGVEADVVYLDLPAGPRIELIYYRHPASPTPPEPNRANLMGLRHIAFRVADIDAVVSQLRAADTPFHSEVATVPSTQVQYAGGAQKRLIYFRDPEDNLLELCEYA